jgi:hypothetical protein
MRKSTYCVIVLCINMLLMGLIYAHASLRLRGDASSLARMAGEVGRLELTDLCLFTESRYTRHLSQADLYSAFQDHPVSLEHFPAGSVADPPRRVRRLYDTLD